MKQRKASRISKMKHWHSFFAIAIVFLLVGAGFFFYQSQKSLFSSSRVATVFSPISTWLAKHKSAATNVALGQLSAAASKKRLAALSANAEPPIHFEFYDALPNVRVAAALPNEDNSKPINPIVKTPSVRIASADDLERELSLHIKQAKK